MPTTEQLKVIQADLTRPIVGIENRTAQEAFDIMCDRIRHHLPQGEGEVKRVAQAIGASLNKDDLPEGGWEEILADAARAAIAALSPHPVSSVSREDVLEEAARWHDQRRRDTPDAFEMEFHEVSAEAIRALKSSTPSVSEGEVERGFDAKTAPSAASASTPEGERP